MSAEPIVEPAVGLRVLVVDDHDVVHWGLRIMLERLEWVERSWSARTGAEALKLAATEEIDLALIDLFVGSESGAEICERLHLVRPGVKVLLISGAGQISRRAAASCGASGFVTKDRRGGDLVRAVQLVANGLTAFEPEEPIGDKPELSARERQVLSLLSSGATNREIAGRLHLSPHTVKDYTSSLYRKLEVRGRIAAAKRAEELGLID
jgi:DNA-binding NarL/FixJ family response regulator